MYRNFLYCIIAIIILNTGSLNPAAFSDNEIASPLLNILIAILLAIIFERINHAAFRNLASRARLLNRKEADAAFSSIENRHLILALVLFASDIIIFKIDDMAAAIPLFSVPSLNAALMLVIFSLYLVIVWTHAYKVFSAFSNQDVSRENYIKTQLGFCIPVFLPWLLVTGVFDLVDRLPFEGLRLWLETEQGQFVCFAVFLIGIATLGPAAIWRLWGCSPLPEGMWRNLITAICRKAGLKFKEILVWPLFGGSMITAGVMGIIAPFRYLLVTPGLLSSLSPDETAAVFAHEIGHVKHKHIWFHLFFLAGFLVIFSFFLNLEMISWNIGMLAAGLDPFSPDKAGIIATLVTASSIFFFFVYFRYIFGFFLRNFERQADLFVFMFFPSPLPLISTFEKIAYTSGQDPSRPNWHHYSIKERIDFLAACEKNPGLIQEHHRKVRYGIAIFSVVLILSGTMLYSLERNPGNSFIIGDLMQRVVEARLDNPPTNPLTLNWMADILLERKCYEKAIVAYKKVLLLDPYEVHALNNLAWLFATSPQPEIRDPKTALELALRAVQISRQPYILDTLAAAYDANGMPEMAVRIQKAAVASVSPDQKKDFEKRLKIYINKMRRKKGGI